ncbi:hypothetical protein CCP2SC5_620017 [Azospirillaceae bacterium]
MALELLISMVVIGAVIVTALIHAAIRIQEVQIYIHRSLARKKAQLERLRLIVRKLMELEKQLQESRRRRDTVKAEYEVLKDKLRQRLMVDRRLYVLDDRRTRDDRSWIVVMSHPNFIASVNSRASPQANVAWRCGRRFLIWALDESKALEKLEYRLPLDYGFKVVSVTEKLDPREAGEKKVRRDHRNELQDLLARHEVKDVK